jgi:two-component system chemotaxis sensor kinase CheA
MSISAQVRERLLNNFRAELAEHVQTMTDGLLSLEQGAVSAEQSPELAQERRQNTLEDIFRAAHSLKGAARALGVTAIEQLAHALEDVLDALRRDALEPSSELFNACYRALDAIQAVQAGYESGENTPPLQALQAITELGGFRPGQDAPQQTQKENVDSGKVASSTSNDVVEAVSTPTTVEASPAPGAPSGDETIRVSVSKLDALMAQLSELLITKIRAEQRLTPIRQAQEFITQWQKEWFAARNAYNRLMRQSDELYAALGLMPPSRWPEMPSLRSLQASGNGGAVSLGLGKDISKVLIYVAASQERLQQMYTLMNDLVRHYTDDTVHMSLAVDSLEQEIKRTRMLPLSTITGSFGRMMRDLAQQAGKEAVLHINGANTELDKRVLEQIKDPLIHLLRNAIDHGIEPPAQREALGKPRRGNVILTAEQLGQDVLISVADDGAGLNLEAIRQAVARRTDGDAQHLSEQELQEVIFKAGISTSPIITDISGRGVGLDVVRRNVEALHGRINIDWVPGAGVTFTLTLPLTLINSRGLLVRACGQLFAIPLNVIDRILSVQPEEIFALEGRDMVRSNDHPVTLMRLKDLLELPPLIPSSPTGNSLQRDIPVVVLTAAQRRLALAVDELVGEQELVIKGLGKQLSRVGGIAGATVMGNGEVLLILNAADLIKLASRGKYHSVFDQTKAVAPEITRARRRILVVDDSITTRTLEKNILESAGYSVELAIDGQEALNVIANRGLPDLIVSDIAMPRLNGFELTRQIKQDTSMAHIPVILVTSLDSLQDKTRGIEAGADAYIVKSRFDQNNLLETIEQLV